MAGLTSTCPQKEVKVYQESCRGDIGQHKSNSSAVDFRVQDYCHKSVATQISHDHWLALIHSFENSTRERCLEAVNLLNLN